MPTLGGPIEIEKREDMNTSSSSEESQFGLQSKIEVKMEFKSEPCEFEKQQVQQEGVVKQQSQQQQQEQQPQLKEEEQLNFKHDTKLNPMQQAQPNSMKEAKPEKERLQVAPKSGNVRMTQQLPKTRKTIIKHLFSAGGSVSVYNSNLQLRTLASAVRYTFTVESPVLKILQTSHLQPAYIQNPLGRIRILTPKEINDRSTKALNLINSAMK